MFLQRCRKSDSADDRTGIADRIHNSDKETSGNINYISEEEEILLRVYFVVMSARLNLRIN
jgi:hypothetical protein